MNDSAFAGKRTVVTGGAGFIGSHLARRLVAAGAEVTIVDSLVPQYGGNLANLRDIKPRVRLNVSDVRDPFSIRHLLRDQDYLFNLAGQTSHADSMTDPVTDLNINCAAQLSILEASREVNPDIRVVFASTRQLYGRPEYLPVDELHPLRPVDVNGINKLAGEQYHRLYSEVYGIRSSILRLTNTYGPGMRICDARQTFLGIWIRQALEGQPIEVWGGEQLRDFNYVSDVVDALLLAASSNDAIGQCFNLGGPERISLAGLAQLLCELQTGVEFTVLPFPEERKAIDIGDFYADYSRFSKLGWQPETRLRDGLERTLRYFSNNLQAYL